MSDFRFRDRRVELRRENPFARGRILEYADGRAELVRDFIDYVSVEEDRYHLVNGHDSLISLAYRYYSDEVDNSRDYWWIIAEANQIVNPIDISSLIGTEIIIPDLRSFTINYL